MGKSELVDWDIYLPDKSYNCPHKIYSMRGEHCGYKSFASNVPIKCNFEHCPFKGGKNE